MEGRELPRPPRRVPAGAGTLTQLQTTYAARPAAPAAPAVGLGRFLAGFLVVLLIIAARAPPPAGYVRAREPADRHRQVIETVGHGVVRVLATTCEGPARRPAY